MALLTSFSGRNQKMNKSEKRIVSTACAKLHSSPKRRLVPANAEATKFVCMIPMEEVMDVFRRLHIELAESKEQKESIL